VRPRWRGLRIRVLTCRCQCQAGVSHSARWWFPQRCSPGDKARVGGFSLRSPPRRCCAVITILECNLLFSWPRFPSALVHLSHLVCLTSLFGKESGRDLMDSSLGSGKSCGGGFPLSGTPPFPTWGSYEPRAIVKTLSHQEIAFSLGPHPIRCLAVVTVAWCQNG
jgi:hypothetical protein